MANQLILGRALDANGYIAPGAKATIYADGTSTLISVYSDVAGTIAAANPIVADADGLWPQRYVTEDAKAVVTTSAGVAIYTLDPAPTSQGSGAAASQISFTPSVSPPLPQTNVQDAIIAAANLGVSGFAAFGLGVTGNATLLANLDATGTGAGIYRFDGTTTGTFPTGVAAGDTGAVELWRQTGATAMMELHHATSNRLFRRRMTTTTWGAWREIPVVDQATARGDLVYRGVSDFQRLAIGAAGTFLVGGTDPSWGGMLIVVDEKTSGTAGGTATSGAFRTRDLTTVKLNTISGASLATNQITLPAGTYTIEASAPAYRCDLHVVRLQNITDAATTLTGTSEVTEQAGAIVTTRSHILGTFTIAGSKAFEVQHRVQTTSAGSGFGNANGFQAETYTIVKIQKVG